MKNKSFFLILLILNLFLNTTISFSQNGQCADIEILISSFLGNQTRNFYGNEAPEKLNTIWELYLGEGISPAYGQEKVWKGAGWTGQPLLVKENGELFLILGAFDYNLKKIDAKTGEIVWQYKFDDIIKGTGTILENKNAENLEERYIILQGSRFGYWNDINDKYIPSFRAISYITGKELWRLNVKKTDSYSRDVDGSAIIVNDTAYLALENGIFTVFNPNPKKQKMLDGKLQPEIFQEIKYYTDEDIQLHGNDLVSESSPTLLNNRIYTLSGTGRIYGYNLKTKQNDWEFYIGTDLNGSAPATDDNCLLIPVEKQYMAGNGGVMKINPSKPENERVVWFYPTPNKKWYHWDGGIIGSVTCNDFYISGNEKHFAVFIDITGELTIVDHKSIEKSKMVLGPDSITKYPTPILIAKTKIPGTISTPIIVKDIIIATTDSGIYLYQLKQNKDNSYSLILLDKVDNLEIDATPIVWDKRVYIASRNGYIYCFGE
ncbi:MAG: PQQ-binding-like beta-propeller repeat protein [Bacteroidales bacterium]|nr:PQQ-binding-like beta-propeller repeat protein [Bacteroidales bacterium]